MHLVLIIMPVHGIGRAVAALHFIRDGGVAAIMPAKAFSHIVVNRAGVGHLLGESKF